MYSVCIPASVCESCTNLKNVSDIGYQKTNTSQWRSLHKMVCSFGVARITQGNWRLKVQKTHHTILAEWKWYLNWAPEKQWNRTKKLNGEKTTHTQYKHIFMFQNQHHGNISVLVYMCERKLASKLYLSIMNMRDESIFMAHITGIYSANKCPYHSIILNNKSCGIFVRLHFHFGLWTLWGPPNETMDLMAIYKQNSWILRSQWNDTEWYSLQA